MLLVAPTLSADCLACVLSVNPQRRYLNKMLLESILPMISADSMRDAMQHHDCHIPPLPIPRHDDANLEDPRLTYSQHVTHEHPDSSISNRTSPSSSPHKASPLSLRDFPVQNATKETRSPRNHCRLKGKKKKKRKGRQNPQSSPLRCQGSVRVSDLPHKRFCGTWVAYG
ncbi:hypothetical protein M440DRAFT_1238396 [Trichoderma longibrachiatum ATCC 18648]|uniref:Uncharacterized protein n=1 Tax=Trichoderma longibrachiatum ATCC 18648 TaxID=983965 RepID=A0A2T4C5R3_TRILO|nr:hypothetical protein M440DRAFT_1238396 [Trichoderma longibrachiatum ATCC 18648]